MLMVYICTFTEYIHTCCLITSAFSWHLLVSYTLVAYSLGLRLAAQTLMTAQNNKLVRHNVLQVDVTCIPDLSQVFQSSSSSHYNHNHSKAVDEVRTYCEYINSLPTMITWMSDRIRRSQQ